ncbi:hypothetical protein FACS189430_02980 [Bacteroidia bacterium]|nr:hypothetical protein FACS189430_02980 [Bacteroidia bacterium]
MSTKILIFLIHCTFSSKIFPSSVKCGYENAAFQAIYLTKGDKQFNFLLHVLVLLENYIYFCTVKERKMKYPKYAYTAEDTLCHFEFTSIGRQGQFLKMVEYSSTNVEGVYNIATKINIII